MNTENLFYGSFLAIILAVVFLGWSWISPPKSAPYGTYNPDARVNAIEFRTDTPGCTVRSPDGREVDLQALPVSDGKLVIPKGTMVSGGCLSGVRR